VFICNFIIWVGLFYFKKNMGETQALFTFVLVYGSCIHNSAIIYGSLYYFSRVHLKKSGRRTGIFGTFQDTLNLYLRLSVYLYFLMMLLVAQII
jgi:hypothetical protein